MNFVIGIDASTTKTGVSVFKLYKNGTKKLEYFELIDAEKETVIESELKTKKNDNKATRKKKSNLRTKKRVEYTIQKVMALIHTYRKKGNIVRVGIEDTYGTTDPSSIKSLARIQGAVYGFCLEHDTQLQFLAPSTWRVKVGIPLKNEGISLKRDDFKKLSVQMVKEKYGLDVDDNVADSILIGEVS